MLEFKIAFEPQNAEQGMSNFEGFLHFCGSIFAILCSIFKISNIFGLIFI